MEQMEGYVYCDVHGCVHDETTNPYDNPPKIVDGKPVYLRYADFDEDGNEVQGTRWEKPKVEERIVECAPECTPENWRVLWAGRRMA